MEKKPVLFIYNPKSGDSRILDSLNDLLSLAVADGQRLEVHPTQAPKDATEKLRRDRDLYSRVIAAGGDGLFHEVVNGLDGSNVPLGYLPAGTVNDFATSHGLSFEPLQAMHTALEGEVHPVDAGRFNGEVFSYVAAFGIATSAAYNTPQDLKKRLGPLAYVLAGIQSIDFTHWENNSVQMSVQTDDKEFSGDFAFGMICNSFSVGGTDRLVPDEADLTDGLLDYLFIRRPMNIPELNQILRALLDKEFDSPFFEHGSTRSLGIGSDPVDWTLDGEYGGRITQAHIECLPGVLHLVKQRKEA